MRVILTPDWEQGIHDLADRIQRELQSGKQVLWLVSGGSNITASVKVMQQIPSELSGHLSISLVDERFGPVGHGNSNWTQLLEGGLEAKDAKLLPILTEGASFDEAQAHFVSIISQSFAANMVVIAQFGIGDDGHIAGILPGSAGVTDSDDPVVGYRSEPYTRISLSFAAIRRLTASYTFAFGTNKRQALTNLLDTDLTLTEQPAQILKQCRDAYVYNDQVGG